MKEPDIEQIELIKEHKPNILISSMQNINIAIENKISFMDIDATKTLSYAGYDGSVNFAKDLLRALENPVFKLLSKPAPWENIAQT